MFRIARQVHTASQAHVNQALLTHVPNAERGVQIAVTSVFCFDSKEEADEAARNGGSFFTGSFESSMSGVEFGTSGQCCF